MDQSNLSATPSKRLRSPVDDTSDDEWNGESKRPRMDKMGDIEDTFDFFKLRRELFWMELSKFDATNRNKPIPRDFKLPDRTLDWTPWITHDPTKFVGGGAFGEVYRGKWNDIPPAVGEPPPIAVKVVKMEQNPADSAYRKQRKIFRREVTIWTDLRHPHIVPFVGLCQAHGRFPGLVSLYMEHGNVLRYLNSNPDANEGMLVIGIALGLEFLHSRQSQIIHGDLKAANVVVDNRGWPCLVDFGISRMVTELDTTLWHTTATQAPGTIRWQAPEMIVGSQSTVTVEGDVYAWAMTSLEIITRRCPYSKYKRDIFVINAISANEPAYERPHHALVNDFFWRLYLDCCNENPQSRLSIQEIVRKLMVCIHPFPTIVNEYGRSILSLLADSDLKSVHKLVNSQDGVSPALLTAWAEMPPVRGVEFLLECDSSCVNKEDDWSKTPIFYASKRGFHECVRLLLAQDIDVLSHYKHDTDHPLYLACRHGHDETVQLLLMHLTPSSGLLLRKAFNAAVMNGSLSITRSLHNFGADINGAIEIEEEFNCRMTALQIASAQGNNNIVQFLLDGGANIHSEVGYYGSALQAASYNGHESVVELLLDRGADVHAKGVIYGHYGNALQAASHNGHESVVRLLLDRGADVEAMGGHYGNALQAASYNGHESVVRLLLDRGADVQADDGCYGNALQAASYNGHESVVRLLLDRGAGVHAGGVHALQAAANQGHENILQILRDRLADVLPDNILEVVQFLASDCKVTDSY